MAKEIEESRLLYHSQVLTDLASVWTPHAGQVQIGKALFNDGKKRIFVECGRKFGKTDLVIYSLYRWCMLYPNSFCYYFAPLKDQIADLVWANNRMPYFLPEKLMQKYGVRINNQEQRVIFRNGSFIKCEGTDNYEKARGYSATGLAVYDEIKDQHPKFHDGFEPNLAITDAPLLVVGTPPSEDEDGFDQFCSMADGFKEMDIGFYINRPSMTNPHVSVDYFERKYKELEKKGELWKWEKEYMAKRVRAGSYAMFPMLLKEKHVRPYNDVIEEIKSNYRDWNFHVSFDPGSSSCFAVLFSAVHKYTKKVYAIDEIYAENFNQNSTEPIIKKTIEKINEIMPEIDRWSGVYDYAASWFWNEYQNNYDFGLFINKCEKDLKNKENKLSMIKDMLNGGFFLMTDRCQKLLWEMTKYSTDENGKLKKENDHLIDNLRYTLNDMQYHKMPQSRPLTEQELNPDKRMILLHEDAEIFNNGDIYADINADLFDN